MGDGCWIADRDMGLSLGRRCCGTVECNVGTLSLVHVEMDPKNTGVVVHLDGRGVQAGARCGQRLSKGGKTTERGWSETSNVAEP